MQPQGAQTADMEFRELRSLLGCMPKEEVAVAGHAVALSQWHAVSSDHLASQDHVACKAIRAVCPYKLCVGCHAYQCVQQVSLIQDFLNPAEQSILWPMWVTK